MGSKNRNLLDDVMPSTRTETPPKPPSEHPCDHCSAMLPQGKSIHDYGQNHIVGRSKIGGFICRDCYERSPNFDYRDRAFKDFSERHRNDEWGAILSASRSLKTTEERRELLKILKQKARSIGNPEIVQKTRNAA